MTLFLPSPMLKAMLHEAIFLATWNATNVALQVARKKFTCNTPFCNCNCCVASCKKSRTTLYFSQRCETSCLRVTSLCNLKGFLLVIVALQVARKIASCSMALKLQSDSNIDLLHHFRGRLNKFSTRFSRPKLIYFFKAGIILEVRMTATISTC